MQRFPRIEGENLVYYITASGKNGQHIFKNDRDRLYFLNILRQERIKRKLVFYAYILLPNHYVLLLETQNKNLIQTMHQINSSYANYFNRSYNRANRLFKDRYTCFVIEKNYHMTDVSGYIHMLSKKASSNNSPESYTWSSYQGYLNEEKRESWIDYNMILDMFSDRNQEISGNYRKHIENAHRKHVNYPFKNMKHSYILGCEEFKKKIEEKCGLKEEKKPEYDAPFVREIIKLAYKNLSWSSILTRNAAIYFVKKYTDLNNEQISKYFSPLKKSSISQMNRRFNFAIKKDEAINKTSISLEEKIRRIVS